jgi:hypothetical protein
MTRCSSGAYLASPAAGYVVRDTFFLPGPGAGSDERQVLLYDHVLTLGDEVKYIWSAPTTLAKILFLTLRYMVPAFMTVETISAHTLMRFFLG